MFDDEKGASWSAFLEAALKPVEAAISAASKTKSVAGVQQHDSAGAARELWCVFFALRVDLTLH